MTTRYRSVVVALMFLALPIADATAGSGGASAPGQTEVNMVACSGSTRCRAPRVVVRGQKFVVRGRGLARMRQVVFRGGASRRDDAVAPVTAATSRSAVAVVPVRARTGPVALQGWRRRHLGLIRGVRVSSTSQGGPLDGAPGNSFYYGGRSKPTYEFTVSRPAQVGVELVDQETGAIVSTWRVEARPGVPSRVSWGGVTPVGVAPSGRYRFRLASGPAAPVAGTTSDFFFGDHLFPIRGRHDLGQTPTNGFGGGGQRRHMGQDMFARCGTKLVAARGGTVRSAQYQSAAGNYVVIDGAGPAAGDYVYMHMRKPALVHAGDRVFTGQQIGEVGETGRASGCHLHFELWSAPGWFVGGKAFDPLPSLKAWDAYS